MTTRMRGLGCWGAWVLLACLPCGMAAEECKPGESTTGIIKGTVHLTNANPEILNVLCQPPGEGEGFVHGYVWAYSVNHDPPLQAYATIDSAKSCVEADFEITVEACTEDHSGIVYRVTVQMYLDSQTSGYWFEDKLTEPVKVQQTVVLPPFEECAGMLDIRWVDKDGNPDVVTGGEITAYRETETGGWEFHAQQWRIPEATNQEYLTVRGEGRYKVVILYDRGADPYSDKVRCRCESIVDVACDGEVKVVCETCEESLGAIAGQVDFLGKEEHSVGGFTKVAALYGPFENYRLDRLARTPSSGAFELEDLVASDAEGYQVYAEMRFGTGTSFQAFRTPCLGIVDPPVLVRAGETADLADTFVVDPGLVKGSIVLVGPRSEEGKTGACLEDIHRASDTPGSAPGLPEDVWLYSGGVGGSPDYFQFRSSGVIAAGVPSRAGAAQFSSAGGFAMALFDGDFDPATGRFEGAYELALGGLNQEPSLWTPNRLELLFQDEGTSGIPESYQDGNLQIINERIGVQEIAPGRSVDVPHHYCFGQVYLGIYSTTGKFHQPHIRHSQGSFQGEDFEGNPAKYNVVVGNYPYVNGTPLESADASNLGVIVLCLPEGTYTLHAYVNYGDSVTEVQPFELEVRCGQVQKIYPDLGFEFDSLLQADSVETVMVSGRVRSALKVTRITYSHNNKAPTEYCRNCEEDPASEGSYPFSFPVRLERGDNTIQVNAETEIKDVSGGNQVPMQLNFFLRGDPDGDGKVDIADVVYMAEYLFKSGDTPGCLDSADANDDGKLNIVDPIFTLQRLFHGGGELPPPSGKCGPSPTKNKLTCHFYPCKA